VRARRTTVEKALVLVGLSAACTRQDGEEPPNLVEMHDLPASPGTMDGTDTDGNAELEPGADICIAAASVGDGVFSGDLRGKGSNNGGACELGGPDVFFGVDVPFRADVMLWARGAGYEPRVGVRHSDCTARFADVGLLCVSGIPGWIEDIALGTRLIVSVGIDPGDPALAGDAALPFEFEVAFRPVLEEGERCEPQSVGRCESGTHCMLDPSGDGSGPAICVAVAGDTCASALPLSVEPGSTEVEISADAIHGDAHHHACTGARTAERVYRVQLAGDLGPDARVDVEAPFAEGLAVRGPGCLSEQELACAADGDVLPPPSFYLFVELPDAAERDPTGGEEPPYAMRILFDAG
jgi:hypothetical protein